MTDLSGTRVLIVEDEPVIAMDHADCLAEAGAEVIGPFPGSEQALTELDRTAVDVAVIDFVLNDQNTVALQEELERRHVPFVVVTGYPKILVRRTEEQSVLGKPVNGDDLCEAVKRVCFAD